MESVASFSWQPAYAGVGPAPRVWMGEAKDASLNRIKKVEGEAVEKGISEAEKLAKGMGNVLGDGTVWENIKMTQPFYEGTKIPKSFELEVDEKNSGYIQMGQNIWLSI
ncbi:hypothetical protein B4113_1579 [Geobacillus sp. B4113_201601]|nr:hypothetical protein B4113_1579 [Geobacillus sp. B4113_201601]